ncbi:hypothetical protein M3M38_07305 [Fructilactobacillus cliffordii]|uniref:hypothetical protein n=1 Tax=Fructilactobacillus cliffordii TaxID=2940299 RepID=UPI0020939A42|nr:hypothetical protein [Fructilactobacillus cliffordii]USS86466.1 hypothetical protein M3M38_07305 [Fructilactobacillus cliffordii]
MSEKPYLKVICSNENRIVEIKNVSTKNEAMRMCSTMCQAVYKLASSSKVQRIMLQSALLDAGVTPDEIEQAKKAKELGDLLSNEGENNDD